MTENPGQQPSHQPPYVPQGGYQPLPKHPQSTSSLVVGIIGIVVCGGLISPIAWYLGSQALKEIDANPGVYDGRGEAQAGKILGIVGTALLVLGIIAFVLFILFVVVVASTTTEFSSALALLI